MSRVHASKLLRLGGSSLRDCSSRSIFLAARNDQIFNPIIDGCSGVARGNRNSQLDSRVLCGSISSHAYSHAASACRRSCRCIAKKLGIMVGACLSFMWLKNVFDCPVAAFRNRNDGTSRRVQYWVCTIRVSCLRDPDCARHASKIFLAQSPLKSDAVAHHLFWLHNRHTCPVSALASDVLSWLAHTGQYRFFAVSMGLWLTIRSPSSVSLQFSRGHRSDPSRRQLNGRTPTPGFPMEFRETSQPALASLRQRSSPSRDFISMMYSMRSSISTFFRSTASARALLPLLDAQIPKCSSFLRRDDMGRSFLQHLYRYFHILMVPHADDVLLAVVHSGAAVVAAQPTG